MTLPTGTITMNDINIEIQRSSGAAINLNDSTVRALSGQTSGYVDMNSMRGKSYGPTFSIAPGTYDYTGTNSVGVAVNSSLNVTFTYSKDGVISASVGSGTVTNSISFSNANKGTTGYINLTATYGNQTYSWRFGLTVKSGQNV